MLPKNFPTLACTLLLSGIAMGLAPVNAWQLAWLAMIPLWQVVFTPQGLGSTLRLAALWGIGYHGTALAWITGIHPMDWMGVPWLASLAIAGSCWLLVTLWGAALVVVWAGILRCLRLRLVGIKLAVGVGLWCGLEMLWSRGDLWWSTIAYTQSPQNLLILQLGKLSGTSAIAAVLLTVNALLALAANQLMWLYPALGLMSAAHLLGLLIYTQPIATPGEMSLKVGIIQGNIPNAIKLYPEGWYRAIAGYTTGYQQLAEQGVAAVLTPETALPFVWQEQVNSRSSFYEAILTHGVTAWVGGFGRRGDRLTNSLFTVNGRGQTLNQYDKSKLVPLGEYVPDFLNGLVSRLSPIKTNLAKGAPDQVFDTPFGRAIVGICYESAFGEHFRRQRGGEFILTASNNAHYSAAMPAQHHAQDVMRAIESDRWAVRATNTGYSGIVDPHGNTLWRSKLNTYAVHAHTIYRRQTTTPYFRWGDWLTWLLLVSGTTLAALDWVVTKVHSRAS